MTRHSRNSRGVNNRINDGWILFSFQGSWCCECWITVMAHWDTLRYQSHCSCCKQHLGFFNYGKCHRRAFSEVNKLPRQQDGLELNDSISFQCILFKCSMSVVARLQDTLFAMSSEAVRGEPIFVLSPILPLKFSQVFEKQEGSWSFYFSK